MTAGLHMLRQKLEATWRALLARSELVKTVERGEVTKSLYAAYLIETYHYTRYNARNQALAGTRVPGQEVAYMKFCFEHAAEETGHELMALHDLRTLGVDSSDVERSRPLAATEVLIAYIDWVSRHGNPSRRLGYSYWAESAYEHVMPLIRKVQETLRLERSQLTFFLAHSEIDRGHFAQVERQLISVCRTDADWLDVADVMERTLLLTGVMMDELNAEHRRLLSGASQHNAYLRALA